VFSGYWNQPEESGAMLSDGWLHTGDVAVMDNDGFVTIVDRKRDVILASGFSIFPSEIEDVLNAHPAVATSAVVGVPHFYRGETVKAYVVFADGQHASEDELRAYCAFKLVAYKVPTLFEFRTDLPTNMLGKVLRRVLRTEHETAHARVVSDESIDYPTTPLEPSAASAPALTAPVPTADETEELIRSLERLAELRHMGALTDEEFTQAKARLLA
jgi:long-chain acyl-CoA synthetase